MITEFRGHDIAEIEALKYAYFRHLDCKEFDELADLFTHDATASYEDGRSTPETREGIVEWLRSALGTPALVTFHHGHHPEITFTGPDSALGTWYLIDRVIIASVDLEIGGTAFYADEYRREDGQWRIAHTGYRRVYEERRKHTTYEVVSYTNRFES